MAYDSDSAISVPSDTVRLAGLRPLRHRNYAMFWAAGAISDIGTWVQLAAIGSVVAASSGSAASTALIAAATFAPQGICAPIGGVLADRHDRRRLFLTTLGLQTVLTTALAVLVASGVRNPSLLAALVLVQSGSGSLGSPAMQAILPDLVPPSELTAASALGLTGWNMGRVIGPLLAAVLVPFGAEWAVGANAVSFGAMWLVIASLRRRFAPHGGEANGIARELAEGFGALRRTPGCVVAVTTMSLMHLILIPFMGLVPATAQALLGGEGASEQRVTSTASWLMAAQGIGAIVGSVLVASLLHRWLRSRLVAGALSIAGALLAIHAALPQAWMTAVVIAPLGAFIAMGQSSMGGVVQRDAPTAHRGRVLSWFQGCVGLSYGIGLWSMGQIADRVGLVDTFIGCAVVTVVLLAMVARPGGRWAQAVDGAEAPLVVEREVVGAGAR
jgi:MFS family permease